MSFWIRKYKIELERLPLSVLSQSIGIVFVCVAILTTILLLLPIQDTIKGEVVIYANGQPLSIVAPTSGSFHLQIDKDEMIRKGEVIATVDVDISPIALNNLKKLIYDDLLRFASEALTEEEMKDLIDQVIELCKEDLRNIKTELIGLVDQLSHLNRLTNTTAPTDLINALERIISTKLIQIKTINDLNISDHETKSIIKTQMRDDSILFSLGGLSEREFGETKKAYINSNKNLTENELRKQALINQMLNDEKEKISIEQDYRSKIEELRFRIIDQLRLIRSQYETFIQRHVVISPIDGYASLPYDVVDMESVNEGAPLLFLSANRKNGMDAPTAEMYVDAANAGKIVTAMKARVALSEFDQKEFGFYKTSVLSISEENQDGKYKISLRCNFPLETSYKGEDGTPVRIPLRQSYTGQGEVLIGKINLYTKISREIQFSRAKNGIAIVN